MTRTFATCLAQSVFQSQLSEMAQVSLESSLCISLAQDWTTSPAEENPPKDSVFFDDAY
jgi:hypothetical protein